MALTDTSWRVILDNLSWVVSSASFLSVFLLMVFLTFTTMSQVHPDILFGKLYKCVNVVGEKAMCHVARAMYAHDEMDSWHGTMTLREFCVRENINLDLDLVDDIYTDSNLMVEDMDIAFAYFLIQNVCKHYYLLDCQNEIKKLKNLRFKIIHKYGQIKDTFENMVFDLERIIEAIYKDVERVLDLKFDEHFSDVKKLLNDIITEEIPEDPEVATMRYRKEFQDDQMFQIISSGRVELGKHYDKLQILNPLIILTKKDNYKVEKLRVDKIFTPLKIEDEKDEIDLKGLFSVKKNVKGEDRVPVMLLFHGQAGCGKTSLCRYIINEWQNESLKMDHLDSFNLLFLLEVWKVSSESILQYLQAQLMPHTCRDLKPDDMISLLKDMSILFIVDGFDEKKSIIHLISDIFNTFPGSRIIITTRPGHLDDIKKAAKYHDVDYLSVEICGFDDVRLEGYAKMMFREILKDERAFDCDKELENFLEYIDGKGRVLHSHLKLPLTAALLILLWTENPDSAKMVTTATRLYQEIFFLCQERLARRISKDYLEYEEHMKSIHDLLLCLGKQAWSMLQEDIYRLEGEAQDEIWRLCEDKKINPEKFISSFLMLANDEHSAFEEVNYYFLHKTLMEYFAGAFLAYSLETDKKSFKNVTQPLGSWIRFREVLVYLTGHLASQRILHNKEEDLFELLMNIDYFEFNFWWDIVFETRPNVRTTTSPVWVTLNYPKFDKLIGGEMLSRKSWPLNYTNVVSGLKLLGSISCFPSHLAIDIEHSKNPQDIPSFLETLQNVSEQLKQRLSRRNFKVTLHLWSHDGPTPDRTSDSFLHALNPWANLEHFTGSLKEYFEFSNHNIKTIRLTVYTEEALRSICNLPTCVKVLRVTLELPRPCEPTTLPCLEYNGDLEITLIDMKDEDKNWIVNVVQRLASNRVCQRLYLTLCALTFESQKWLVKRLSGIIFEKLVIDAADELEKGEKKALQKIANFLIEWTE